jgi:putative FmdB family regulatory protein
VPIYEYRCSECGHQFEVSQRMTDDPVGACEVCGGAVSKLLFAPAIHFKGTGFHNTDYGARRRNAAGEEGGAPAEGASANGGGAKKPEPAPAASGASAGGSSGSTVGLDKV